MLHVQLLAQERLSVDRQPLLSHYGPLGVKVSNDDFLQ